jgi:hypothetical protein
MSDGFMGVLSFQGMETAAPRLLLIVAAPLPRNRDAAAIGRDRECYLSPC